MATYDRFTITMPPALLADVDARGEKRSTVITEQLERYFALLARARTALRDQFSVEELGLLADVGNGARYEAQTLTLLPMQVADAIRYDKLDAKWGVDGAGLAARLTALDALSLAALVDGIERFWNTPTYHQDQPDFSQVLR